MNIEAEVSVQASCNSQLPPDTWDDSSFVRSSNGQGLDGNSASCCAQDERDQSVASLLGVSI